MRTGVAHVVRGAAPVAGLCWDQVWDTSLVHGDVGVSQDTAEARGCHRYTEDTPTGSTLA